MKSLIGSFIGLVLSVSVGAESLLEGQVRLSSGQPAAGVQVRLFDLTDLRRFVGTTTDAAGHFALPLQTVSTARSMALPTDFALGQNYPQSIQSLDDHSLSPVGVVPCEAGGVQPAGAAAGDIGGCGTGGGGAYRAVGRNQCGGKGGECGGVHLSTDGRRETSDGAHGAHRRAGRGAGAGEDATAGAAGRGCPRSGVRAWSFRAKVLPPI